MMALSVTMFIILSMAPNRADKVCNGMNITIVDEDVYNFVDTSDIIAQLKYHDIDIVGKSLSELDLSHIERTLEGHPMLKEVVCYQTVNGNVSIEVEQKFPIFRVINDTSNYYVNNMRERMPVSLNYVAYVPIVTGNVSQNFATLQLYDFVVYLQEDEFMSSLVGQIHVFADNEIEISPRVGDFKINFGTIDRYPTKVEKLKTFYTDVLPKVGWDKYQSISLNYADQVVATKRN